MGVDEGRGELRLDKVSVIRRLTSSTVRLALALAGGGDGWASDRGGGGGAESSKVASSLWRTFWTWLAV